MKNYKMKSTRKMKIYLYMGFYSVYNYMYLFVNK